MGPKYSTAPYRQVRKTILGWWKCQFASVGTWVAKVFKVPYSTKTNDKDEHSHVLMFPSPNAEAMNTHGYEVVTFRLENMLYDSRRIRLKLMNHSPYSLEQVQ